MGKSRPGGKGRPPGRIGRGGVGPGPAPYRDNGGYGGGGVKGGSSHGGCCPMVAALASLKRGKFRLAGRYARWSLRLMAARFA